MQIHLTPEQEQIINDALKSGHFRSAEEVVAKALSVLHEKEALPTDQNGRYETAVREMIRFAEKNRTPLHGVSVKQLLHEGHRL